VDALTDILTVAQVTGSVAASLVAGEPWGLRLDAVPGAAFHAISAGTAWLWLAGGEPIRLMPGDAVLLPGGASHTLTSAPDAATHAFDHERAEAALAQGVELALGVPPNTTRILCASYRHDPAATLATFSLLPQVLHVPALDAAPGLRTSLELLGDELRDAAPGRRAVLDHIVNVMLIQMIRAWIARTDPARCPPSWLRGLADPVIREALARLHAEPARPWTIDELARRIGVSRATLARRFASEVGHSPADYLTRWRMELAAHRLRGADDPVGTIARGVGYTSEYAFNRAFTRLHGLPPGRYRAARRPR
jgi:AraC-like DNA-binding protein